MSNIKYDLSEAILVLKDKRDCEAFIKDLCTPKEIKDLEERWLIAQYLSEGNMSYREIHKQTGVSLATITRVARFLIHEHNQGYKTIITRLKEKGSNKQEEND